MAIDFSGLPFANYKGSLASKSYQRFNQSGTIIAAVIDWSKYDVNGIPLGGGEPAFSVNVNFTASAKVPSPFQLASIFIDNTGSNIPVYVTFPDTGYTVTVQSNAQGWFPVVSNSPTAVVSAINLLAPLPVTKVFFTDLYVQPYTDASLPEALQANIASPVIGGGASLTAIGVQVAGQSYVNGGLAISGGGGSGASAHGILDNWGRFTSVILDGGGTGFIGQPVITPTAGNPAATQFLAGSTININQKVSFSGTEWQFIGPDNINTGAANWVHGNPYNPPTQVRYMNYIFQCINPINFSNLAPPDQPVIWQLVGYYQPLDGSGPYGANGWSNSGTAGGTTASFAATLGALSSALLSQGFGVPALGDQAVNDISVINGTGKFLDNIFGTPYGLGFIYLTHIDISVISATGNGANTWSFINSAGYAPFAFEYVMAAGAVFPGKILSLQKMNMKLDATKTWTLNCGALASASLTLSHGFVWSYSET